LSASFYSVVRYVPDPIRGEQVNVGAVVVSEDGSFAGAKFLKDFQRARALNPSEDFSFLRDFASDFERAATRPGQLALSPQARRWTIETLRKAHLEWANAIQLSEPRAAVNVSPEELLEETYRRYVQGPPRVRERARDSRWVVGQAVHELRSQLRHRVNPEAVKTILRKDQDIRGALDTHRFDVVLQSANAQHLVAALSFEIGDKDEIAREVDATAWAIDDVRKADRYVPVSVLAIERDGSTEFERAERIYSGLDARFVPSLKVPEWAAFAARSVTEELQEAVR